MLSQHQTRHFQQHGYCLAEGLLKPRDFEAVIADCTETLDGLCERLRADGNLQNAPNDYAGLPFLERYLNVSRDTGGVFAQHFTIALPQQGVCADTPIFLASGVFDLMRHPAILDAVESLIGPEIAASPVGNVRIKPPEKLIPPAHGRHQRRGLFRATPWHQDNGVVTADADEVPMITVWFPISDAPPESGCLQVIPGSHRRELRHHCPDINGELSIPDRLLEQAQAQPLPMRAGDVLFLHRRLCHASLPNVSDGIRWSFDLRYLPAHAAGGRDLFPTFIARSRADPDSVLTDPAVWAQMWLDARANLAAKTPPRSAWNRWSADAEACA